MKALKIPFEVSPDGRTATVEGEYPVFAAYLHMLLLTRLGERVMRPTYGTSLQDAVFEPLDDLLQAEIDGDIRDAARDWEPSLDITNVSFVARESKLDVNCTFRVRSNLSGETSAVSVTIDAGGSVEETPL